MRRDGCLVVLEGIDGTGKSTLAKSLCLLLEKQGIPSLATFEPTNGPHGRKLRESFAPGKRLDLEEELRLFTLDRREHVERTLLPALKAGKVVICDRYYFSTMAYQGARGVDPESIRGENEAFAPRPDLILLLELPPREAAERINKARGEKLNSFEQLDYLREVDKRFKAMNLSSMVRLDASLPPKTLAAKAFAEVVKACGKAQDG